MKKYTGLEIAVIGMAGKFPKADNVEQYWDNLKNGRDCISELSEIEVAEEGENVSVLRNSQYVKANAFLDNKQYFDAAFFGYRPDEAELMDPQIRIFHECCWEALEDSGYGVTEQKDKVGIFATATPNLNWSLYALHKNREQLVDGFSAAHLSETSFLSSRISYKLNLKGPALFLQTACSSSLVTIHEACNSLLLGECSMALAGGVTINNYSKKGYLYEKGMINSKDGKCRPFDIESNGTVGGEGAGVVVLKKLKDAIRDRDNIYGIIKGTGLNNDGNNKVGYSAPGVKGQVDVIKKAHKMAGVEPETISYVEAHGTATDLGDVIEIDALNEVFGNKNAGKCAIGSVKSNIGHLDSAAGVSGFIKTVLALKHRQLPASLHFTAANPRINFGNGPFYVNSALKDWNNTLAPLRAGVSSFGIGGTNAHIVLEEAPTVEKTATSREAQLLLLSAQTKESLHRNTEKLAAYFAKDNNAPLADIAYTLQKGRERFKFRRALVCSSKTEALKMLTGFADSEPVSGDVQENLRNIVFMFSGQGAQYESMCRHLYEKEPLFRDQLDQCLQIAQKYSKANFYSILFDNTAAPEQDAHINNTRYAQPLLFFIEYSMAQLLINWGIQPDYMIGHSIGEYTAACISGVFSLTDAIQLVIRRGELVSSMEKGSMLHINIGVEALKNCLETFPNIDLATVNSEKSLVVSGNKEDIRNFEAYLVSRNYNTKLLHTSHAFHSRMMDGAVDEFEKLVASVTINNPQVPYVSNLTGELVTANSVKDPAYWGKHLRNTVQFFEGTKYLLKQGKAIFIELGPGRALSNYVKDILAEEKGCFITNTIRQASQQADDAQYLLDKIGQLWMAGVKINWDNYYAGEERRRTSLPTYSFEKKSFTTDVNAFQIVANQLKNGQAHTAQHNGSLLNGYRWQLSAAVKNTNDLKQLKAAFIVFSDSEGFGHELSAYLRLHGQNIIEVRKGEAFRKKRPGFFEMNYANPEDFTTLWTDITESGAVIDHIIYCAGITSAPAKNTYDSIGDRLMKGYIGLSSLAKAIAATRQKQEITISIINNYLAAISEEDDIDPIKAAIHGPSRVIPLEMMNTRCKVIDIPYPYRNYESGSDYLPKLINEMQDAPADPFVAYRFKQRWTRVFSAVDSEEENGSGCAIEKGGTYLLTGALGGMGLSIAHDIVCNRGANVLMVYRSAFPDKKEWDTWVADKGLQDETSKKIMQLREMMAAGGVVELFQADVSDEEQVRKLSKEIKSHYDKINGLIWAAGEIDYGGILANRKTTDLLKPVSSKIHGLLLFEKYFQFTGMDFISLFSSIGNVLYQTKFGQAGYNAANEFLENYSYYLQREYGIHAFAINWCDWRNVGMTVKARLKEAGSTNVELISDQITDGIYPSEGIEVFHRCLARKSHATTIYRESLTSAINSHQGEYNKIKEGLRAIPATATNTGAEIMQPEQQLLQIFTDFFGRTSIGADDDFFELGGDSLMGMTFAARINQQFGSNLSVTDIYKYPTLRLLLGQLATEVEKKEWTAIPKATEKAHYSLSSPQRRMYFLQMFDKESIAYNENILFWLNGKLDKEKFNFAFRKIISRHEILRSYFIFDNETPLQVVKSELDFKVQYGTCTTENADQVIDAFVQPFDLNCGPLIRAGIFEASEEKHLVILDMHHIVMDGISKGILMNEFMCFYNGLELASPALQYKDYAEWQHSEEQKKITAAHKAFWLAQFEDEPAILQLPVDFERPVVKTTNGGTANFIIDKPHAAQLKNIADEEGVSMFMLLLAVYYVLLSKLSSQEDIVIGTPTAGRPHADLENMMGMFVNMVPLRNSPAADLPFTEFLQTVKKKSLDFFANQNFQYEELIESIKIERDLSRNPLFDVVFSHENFNFPGMAIPGLEISDYNKDSAISKFDLRLTTVEKEDYLYGTFEFSAALFKATTIERFIGHFRQIVQSIIENRQTRIANIEIVGNKERELILHDFNNTATVFQEHLLITDLFEEQVKKGPQRTAIIANGRSYSYTWLNESSNQVANMLRSTGIGRHSAVVVIMERNVDLVVVLLGILKAGAKYVPVEPYLPVNRIGIILQSVQAACIVTNRFNQPLAAELKAGAPFVDTAFMIDTNSQGGIEVSRLIEGTPESIELSAFDKENLGRHSESEDLAYVIFTSGSTGDPKGVAVQHRPVINLIEWVNKTYNITENDKLLFVTSVSFDLSVYDIFGILAAGAVIRIASRSELEDPDTLAGIIIHEHITFWDSAPAMLQQVIPFLENRREAALEQGKLGIAFLSGDWIPLTMPAQMKQLFHRLRFIALGGATEATVWSNFFEVKGIDPAWKSIPYGKPIQNAKYFILNKSGNVCPVGTTGDLYIGGKCLAQGYINDTQLSNKKFIPSPFTPGEMLYNTGDIAKWFADGNIEFLGRNDSQIKIRGYRIELGEIERKLIEFDGIDQVLIQVFAKTKYDKFICAYYVSAQPLQEEAMREFLGKSIPSYMVPKYFIHISKIPVTKNGKIDRKLLPSPDLYGKTEMTLSAQTAVQQALTELWASLLTMPADQIGIRDDFFGAGGHSIMAVHLINLIRQQFGISIKLRKIFENPTIEKLARLIEESKIVSADKIVPLADRMYYPVSHAQERLYYEQTLKKNSLNYNVYGAYEIKGTLDIERLQQSFRLLIERHCSLRTSFLLQPEGLVQKINTIISFDLEVIDNTQIKSATKAFERFVQPFDLAAPSLIRCAVFRQPGLNLLFVDIHHIVCDGISLNMLMNDFKNIYSGKALPSLALRYVDYAHWQRNTAKLAEKQKNYWKQQLSGDLIELQLPVIQDRNTIQIQNAIIKTVEVQEEDYKNIQQFLVTANVSPYMFFISVFYLLLSKISGNADIIIGTDVMGRTQEGLDKIVGTFINLLPLRMEVKEEDNYLTFLSRVKNMVLDGFENQDYQYDQMLSDLMHEQRLPARLVAAHFAFANYYSKDESIGDVEMVPFEQNMKATTQFECKLEVREDKGKYKLLFFFSRELFSPEIMDVMAEYYVNIMDTVLTTANTFINEINMEESTVAEMYLLH